jgi:hypothetical protein
MSNNDDYVPPPAPKMPAKLKKLAATLLGTALRSVILEALKQGANELDITPEDIEASKTAIDNTAKEIISPEYQKKKID